jgi:hypothetical protein
MERLKFAIIAITLFIVCAIAFGLIRRGVMTPVGASLFFMLGYPLAWMLHVRIKEVRETDQQQK